MTGKINYRGISAFWNSRFKILYDQLSPKNAEMFKQMNLKNKKIVVERMVKKGLMR